MQFVDLLSEAMHSLRIHVFRCVLTVMGIALGIVSVVIVIAVGEGMQQKMEDELHFASGKIILKSRGRTGTVNEDPSTALTVGDVAVLSQLPYIELIAPRAIEYSSTLIPGKEWGMELVTTTPEYFVMEHLEIVAGRVFTLQECRERAPVCVLRQKLAIRWFNNEKNALGSDVRVGLRRHRVVGICDVEKMEGEKMAVYIPFSLGGPLTPDNATMAREIQIALRSGTDPAQAGKSIEELLLKRRPLLKFWVANSAELFESKKRLTYALQMFLFLVALITIVVGGIGIMTVMLIGVRERAREIGLRIALGATHRDIFLQFLSEALLLGVGGGCLGGALSFASAFLLESEIERTLGMSCELSAAAFVCAFLLAMIIAFVFGVAPARSASKTDPALVLRME